MSVNALQVLGLMGASCHQLIDRNAEVLDLLDTALNEIDARIIGFVVEGPWVRVEGVAIAHRVAVLAAKAVAEHCSGVTVRLPATTRGNPSELHGAEMDETPGPSSVISTHNLTGWLVERGKPCTALVIERSRTAAYSCADVDAALLNRQ